jgi:hypothetical protein
VFTKIITKAGTKIRTTVVIKQSIFWDITPCSPLKVNRRFGGVYLLHLQCRKISRERHPLLATCFQSGFLFGLFSTMIPNIIPSRLSPYIDEIIGNHQCGFRCNRSTTHQIRYWGKNHQLFVDFKKAYD